MRDPSDPACAPPNGDAPPRVDPPPPDPPKKKPRRSRAADDEPLGFPAFWGVFPRGTAKQKAIAAWRKIPESEHAAVMAGLEPWIAYWADRGEPEFVPHAATWLNDRRWEKPPPVSLQRGPRRGRFDPSAILDALRVEGKLYVRCPSCGEKPLPQADTGDSIAMARAITDGRKERCHECASEHTVREFYELGFRVERGEEVEVAL